MCEIHYDISLYPTTKVWARHWTKYNEKNPNPLIRIYLNPLSKSINLNLDNRNDEKHVLFFRDLVDSLIYGIILERICLECRLNNKIRFKKGLSKIRIRGRCKPHERYSCKMDYVADKIFQLLGRV